MNTMANEKIKSFLQNGTLSFDSSDSGLCYDFCGEPIECKGKVAVTVNGAEGLTLRGLNVSGKGGIGVELSDTCKSVRLEVCRLTGFDTGICDRGGSYLLGNTLDACGTGILIESARTTARGNTLRGCDTGISACFDAAEISAAMAKGYNILIAQNKVNGAKHSIVLKNASNSVVLLNDADSCEVRGCINAYVAENKADTLTLVGNDYLIANKNRFKTILNSDNTNVNGDNVTDLDERAACGVNERLLPHINVEQFVGMECRDDNIDELIRREAEQSDVVIVPPGAYLLDASVILEAFDNKKIYAYGVLRKMTYSEYAALALLNSHNTEIKGLFVMSDVYPHIQGTVVECGEQTYSFIADPGYHDNFSDCAHFGEGAPGGIFRPNELSPCSETYYKTRSFDPDTGINKIEGSNFIECKVGYRVAHRNWKGTGGISFRSCSDIVIEDVTVLCSSGFAEYDGNSLNAPFFHRYAVHRGPAPVLAADTELSRWNGMGLVTTDKYGRLRGPEPLNTTCDATHSTNAKRGMRMVSCLMERMNDDGGNINAYYGTPISFDSKTKTLVYTHCMMYFKRTGSRCVPWTFKKGDRAIMYGKNGKLMCRAKAVSDGKAIDEERFEVVLDTDVILPADLDFVVLQNLDGSGTGFEWDNVCVRDSLSFGVRIQANSGKIENCSFVGTAKGGIHVVPQYGYWPECGYASDVVIRRNYFADISKMSGANKGWSQEGFWLPLSIYTGDDLHHTAGNADADYCLHENITVEDNTFGSRYTDYAVYASAVGNFVMKRNRFLPRVGKNAADDLQAPVWIAGGNGVTLEENVFPSGVSEPYKIDEERTENVSIKA